MERRVLKVGRYAIELTHEDKRIFPGISKGEFVAYYQTIAPIILPYMKNRPVTMHRFVNGIAQEGFYQKDAGSYFSSWISTKAIKKQGGGVVHYVVCNNAATLVYLANQLCITPHIWLSKIDKLRYPDRMIFDLDPSINNFRYVCKVAERLRELLQARELTPFVMTTGSRGLHVVTPLKRTHTFNQVRAFARTIAQEIVNDDPKRCTLEFYKQQRKSAIFIDILRNTYAQTSVAPYAVRARPGAPVATPLLWDELPDLRSSHYYTIRTLQKRLETVGDPWDFITRYARSLAYKN